MLAPAVATAPAGFAPRRAVPHPNPGAGCLPVRLRRQPTPPGGITYAVTTYWEERFGDRTRRDVLTQVLTVHAQAEGPAWVVRCEATPPRSSRPDLSALEQVLHRLAGLYHHLELGLTADGQPVALRNHAEVLASWQGLKQELTERSGGTDAVTQLLLTDLEALLQQPDPLLASLRYYYLYGALFANCYGQLYESGVRYEQPRHFARFFADTDLWLAERLTVAAPPATGRVALRCDGGLDEARTDRARLARSIDAAWAAADSAPARPATDPATVQAVYDATYDVDAATGWPHSIELSVRCRAGQAYCKEYFLRLEPLL